MIQKDIIYGNIELNGVYEEIVNSNDFARLKDITQTAMSTIKYEELEQETRYEHSIGVYYLMCRTLNNLEHKLSVYGLHISKREKELAKMAALLHDIGHGVNSHLLEKITGVSHEQRGIDIIKDPEESEVHQIVEKHYGKDFTSELADFMNCIYGNGEFKEGISLREDNTVPLKPIIASLIAHNVDLDRIDFLVRESTYTKMRVLTDYQALTDSFECVLTGNQLIIGVPKEKQHLIEANILERGRNYSQIYYDDIDFIGNYAFEQLLSELRKHPEEVPETVPGAMRKFLTQERAEFTTKEHLQLTNTPLRNAIEQIAKTTKNEKIRYLCDYRKSAKQDYQVLYNGRSERYIRKLLAKVIPNFPRDSKCIFSARKLIKPYKNTKFGSTNIITESGIEKFEDLPHLVSLEPFERKVMAINPELLRLELGISKEEFNQRYADILQEIITNQAKPTQEFELKYIMTDKGIYAEDIMELLERDYHKKDEAEYSALDIYYDSLEQGFPLLAQGSALRIRHGHTYYKGKESRDYKSKRATYKSYTEDGDTTYTTRNKMEEIGDTLDINDYQGLIKAAGIITELSPALEVRSHRKLVTMVINGQEIDVSFIVFSYQNCIYEMPGFITIVEIRPKDNKVLGRLLLLEVKKKLEEAFPNLEQLVTNANIYEFGMAESYEKYKKGYIISDDAEMFEKQNPVAARILHSIVDNIKRKRKLSYLDNIMPADELTH